MIKSIHIGYFGVKGIPAQGGAERVVESLIYYAVKNNYTVTIYCRSNYTPPGFSNDRVKIVRIPTFGNGAIGFFIYQLLSLFHALLFGKYDIVHLHNVENAFSIPFLKLKYPVISTSHGKVYDTDKWSKAIRNVLRFCEIIFLKYSNIITCPSLELANYYKGKYLKRRQIYYVPNGISYSDNEINNVNIREIFDKYNLSENNYLVYASNRVLETKGYEVLIKAYLKAGLEIPLLLFGDWGQSKVLYEKYKKLIKNTNIYLVERINGSTLWEIIKKCKIFIFPSYVETQSMMLIEAAICQVPVIYSEIPNNKNIMGYIGIPFIPKDIDDLCSKINMVLNNYDYYKTIAIKNCDIIKIKHDWNKIFTIYQSQYNKLLSGKI